MRSIVRTSVIYFCLAALALTGAFFCYGQPAKAEDTPGPAASTSALYDSDNSPVLLKHLPDAEKVGPKAAFATSSEELAAEVGDRPILGLIDFTGGTEAATAPYDVGRLLIVEFPSPAVSVETDTAITRYLAANPDSKIVYRRIGNYNAMVFDAADTAAANALLDQVKYEKKIQWLGDDPFRISRRERDLTVTTAEMFLSTAIVIGGGIGGSLVAGTIAGLIFFMFRKKRRASMPTFSDAGGMTRLNLDGFTPEIRSETLLNE